MIFDTQMFKKMIKNAYMGPGLHMARERNGYIFSGGYWYMRIRGDVFPKKAKAAVIELVGEFPALDESFSMGHKEEKQPSEFLLEWREIIGTCPQTKDLYYKTNIILEEKGDLWRVWQSEDNRVALLRDLASEIVNITSIDGEKETVPEGPYRWHTDLNQAGMLYWNSNTCEFWAQPLFREEKIQSFLEMAETMILPGKGRL